VELALDCGRKILEVDPLREEIHREMMRLHVRSGHRALALQQYDACRQLLAAELDVEPMEETQSLYREIAPDGSRASGRKPPSTATKRVLPPLRTVAQTLDYARAQLSRAIRMAESDGSD
jgi:DNA-binding SARP family transcriptional activator